jgi:oligoendopeptidase F
MLNSNFFADGFRAAAEQAARSTPDGELGNLPEWNLADLYDGPDSDRFKADLKKAETEAARFAAEYQGKLEALLDAGKGGDRLAAVISDYEGLSDLFGRIGSFMMLYYVGNTTDPARQKFYGDVSQKLTAVTTGLVFFELEFNRLEEAALAAAMDASPALAHYRPWIDDLRKEKPYQLEDRVEQLMHEKSVTAAGAWNRLFDETMAGLKFTVDGEELTLEPTLNLLLSKDRVKREKASDALALVFAKNIALFSTITNTLAKDKEISDRWRGFEDVADIAPPGQPGGRPGGGCAGGSGARVLPEAVASLLQDEGRLAWPRQDDALGPQRAVAGPGRYQGGVGHRAGNGAGCLCGLCTGDGGHRQALL